MNNKRRKRIRSSIDDLRELRKSVCNDGKVDVESVLSSAKDVVEWALDIERDCIDNTPESLQTCDRFLQMEDVAGDLEDAVSNLSDCIECADDAEAMISCLQMAIDAMSEAVA